MNLMFPSGVGNNILHKCHKCLSSSHSWSWYAWKEKHYEWNQHEESFYLFDITMKLNINPHDDSGVIEHNKLNMAMCFFSARLRFYQVFPNHFATLTIFSYYLCLFLPLTNYKSNNVHLSVQKEEASLCLQCFFRWVCLLIMYPSPFFHP